MFFLIQAMCFGYDLDVKTKDIYNKVTMQLSTNLFKNFDISNSTRSNDIIDSLSPLCQAFYTQSLNAAMQCHTFKSVRCRVVSPRSKDIGAGR